MISLSAIRLLVDLKAKDEDYLIFLRDLAVSQLESATGRSFSSEAGRVQYFTTERYQSMIQLSFLPVNALNSVAHRDFDTQDWTTIDATDYNFTTPRTIRLLSGCFRAQVKVDYDSGYSEANVPDKIKNPLLVQIRYLNNRLDPAKIDVKSKALESGATTTYMHEEYHPIFKKLLDSLS